MLSKAIIELYMNLKNKLKFYCKQSSLEENGINGAQDNEYEESVVEEEKCRLAQLGNLVVVDYISSSMDILLSLKIEQAVLDQQTTNPHDIYINSSRGGHGPLHQNDGTESQRSSNQSSLTNREGPPKIYEEIIVGLEAEVRKHIRIEQQLKLHIESIESRLDELELENEQLG